MLLCKLIVDPETKHLKQFDCEDVFKGPVSHVSKIVL